MNSVLSAYESSTLGGILSKTLFGPSPLMELVARVLCMCVELLVPLEAVGVVSKLNARVACGWSVSDVSVGWCCV